MLLLLQGHNTVLLQHNRMALMVSPSLAFSLHSWVLYVLLPVTDSLEQSPAAQIQALHCEPAHITRGGGAALGPADLVSGVDMALTEQRSMLNSMANLLRGSC